MNKETPPECEQSWLISMANVGMLNDACPTQQHIDDLIAHIRGCPSCQYVLQYSINEGPQSEQFPRDKRLDGALEALSLTSSPPEPAAQ